MPFEKLLTPDETTASNILCTPCGIGTADLFAWGSAVVLYPLMPTLYHTLSYHVTTMSARTLLEVCIQGLEDNLGAPEAAKV